MFSLLRFRERGEQSILGNGFMRGLFFRNDLVNARIGLGKSVGAAAAAWQNQHVSQLPPY